MSLFSLTRTLRYQRLTWGFVCHVPFNFVINIQDWYIQWSNTEPRVCSTLPCSHVYHSRLHQNVLIFSLLHHNPTAYYIVLLLRKWEELRLSFSDFYRNGYYFHVHHFCPPPVHGKNDSGIETYILTLSPVGSCYLWLNSVTCSAIKDKRGGSQTVA